MKKNTKENLKTWMAIIFFVLIVIVFGMFLNAVFESPLPMQVFFGVVIFFLLYKYKIKRRKKKK